MVGRLSVKEILKNQNKKIHAETMELAVGLLSGEQAKRLRLLNDEIANLSRTIDSNDQRVDECERALNPAAYYKRVDEKSEAARESIRALKKYYETKVSQTRQQRVPLLSEQKAIFDKAMLENPGFAFQAHALAATRWAEYALDNVPGEVETVAVVREKALRNMAGAAEEAEQLYMSAIKTSPDQREAITKRQINMRITIGKVR